MNYELAKQLKKAGFKHNHIAGCYEYEFRKTDCSPTLSELIAACGDRFNWLARITLQTGEFQVEDGWEAMQLVDVGETPKFGHSKTPEEAVAKLWLALNRKN